MNSTKTESKSIISNTANLLSKKECSDIGIYGLKNKTNGKWYVGQSIYSIQGRWQSYKNLKCSSQPKLLNALKKYGYESFDKVILEECISDRRVIDVREDYWIKFYNCVENGYNCKYGGANGKMSEEAKVRVREGCKKRVYTDEWKKALSENGKKAKGRIVSEETKNKMKESQKVRYNNNPDAKNHIKRLAETRKLRLRSTPVSDETKRKISAATKGKIITNDCKNKMSAARKEYLKVNAHPSLGRKHSTESCEKMSVHDRSGLNCPSLGKIWINNGIESKKIPKEQPMPDGFSRGRLFGTVWAHNGTERKFIKKDAPLPTGYVYGKLYSKKKTPSTG
jgi:group I intron endonuclease